MLNKTTLEASMEHLSPESRRRLEIYVAEANFFDSILSGDLRKLPQGSRVMEIGSGIGLLSLRTAAKGFEVVSHEPQSAGFPEMLDHRRIILTSWQGTVPRVTWRDTYLSSTTAPPETERAAFAFAINVLEHVPDVESLVAATMQSLMPGGWFRFICPNYAFPYEPHFEIPTLIHKAATFRVFQKRIRASPITDPMETWDELSWPNVWKISKMLTRMNLRYTFSRSATKFYLDRVKHDSSFSTRKGPTVRAMFRLGATAVPAMLALTPISMLPLIDCTVYSDS